MILLAFRLNSTQHLRFPPLVDVFDRQDELLDRIVERHRNEGLHYVEYRAMRV